MIFARPFDNFCDILSKHLDAHAVLLLASQHCTERPMESAESDALRVAKQFGDLSPIERVQVLFQNVLTSPYNPKQKMLSSSTEDKKSFDRTDYDAKSQAKGVNRRFQAVELGCVLVHLLQREQCNPAGKRLKKVELDIGKREKETLYVRGRAAKVFSDPSDESTYKAIHDILDTDQPDIAPKMTKLLNESEKPDVFVAVAPAGRELRKVGRKAPRFRTPIDNELLHYSVLDSDDYFARWVNIDQLHRKEFMSMLLPPFDAYKPGVLNVYVLPADDSSLPAARLDLQQGKKMVDRLQAHGPASFARQNAEVDFRIKAYADSHGGKNPHNRKKRTLDADEDEDLQRACAAAYDAAHAKRMGELQATPRERVKVKFPRHLYPNFHEKSDARPEVKQRATEERNKLCKRGRGWLAASEENAKIARAHPGGKDYLAAMDAFVANAASTD